jgi:hypothetical protein
VAIQYTMAVTRRQATASPNGSASGLSIGNASEKNIRPKSKATQPTIKRWVYVVLIAFIIVTIVACPHPFVYAILRHGVSIPGFLLELPKIARRRMIKHQDSEENDLLVMAEEFGLRQKAGGVQKILEVIEKSIEYMNGETVAALSEEIRDNCMNRNVLCAFWAAVGVSVTLLA